ncbi:chemotaxis protein CheW, partial [Myxococcota bacterium]|nr:chemotaxis protein CheW [Myxococcota bacterium]
VGTVLSTQPQISDSEALAEAKQFLVLIASAHEEEQILEIVKEQLDLVPRIKVWDSDPQKEPGAEQKPEQITRAMVSEHSVRVELEVLNSLLRLVGELMISRDRFEVVSKEISEILGDPLMGAETLETAEQLGRLSSNLQDAVMQARMVPVTRVFRTVKRHIRREGRELGISIPFETEGETTELDKNLVDVLTDPIAEFAKSLFRFDTDHVLASKGMFFWAERRWNQIVLGLRTPVRSDDAAMSLLHNAVNGLGGRLEVRERDDDVFDYVLFLPLTLAIIRVMMTRVGDEVYAFPIENLQETLQLESDEITHVKGSRVIALRGEVLSLLFLKEYFDVLSTANEDEPRVLVLADDNSKIGVVVDGLLGIREVVIKPMNSRFSATKTITGSAILGDEHIALILSSDALIRSAIDEANAGSFRPEFKAN